MRWPEIKDKALSLATDLGPDHEKRVKFEFKEVEKQGAEAYWENVVASKKKFDTNKNGLLFPFLLNITTMDPMVGENKIMASPGDISIPGVEIVLEDGSLVSVSEDTQVLTSRGYVPAKELVETDEIVVSN